MVHVETFVSAALKHPWALAIKTPIRNAVWRVRALGVRNPALPDSAARLLFVCKGNICRSPFAAHAASRILNGSWRPTECVSAGLQVKEGLPSPPEAIQAARAHGIALDEHRATALTEALIERADLIIVMEVPHWWQLRRQFPTHANRIFLLPLLDERRDAWSSYERCNIVDPYGKPVEAFDVCYRRIVEGLLGLRGQKRSASSQQQVLA